MIGQRNHRLETQPHDLLPFETAGRLRRQRRPKERAREVDAPHHLESARNLGQVPGQKPQAFFRMKRMSMQANAALEAAHFGRVFR